MLSFLTGFKLYFILAALAIVAIAGAIIARNVRKAMGPPRPARTREFRVKEVVSGTEIVVGERRSWHVKLYGISTPEPVSHDAQLELARLAGSSVKLEEARPEPVKAVGHTGQRRLEEATSRDEPSGTAEAPGSQAEAIRAPPSIAYVHCGEGMAQVILLRKGLATNTSMLSTFVVAEKEAKKAKCGIWGIKTK